MPLKLSDAELDIVMQTARPIAPDLRDAFLHAVANALAGRMVGPGIVHQVCRDLQREFFSPPDFGHQVGGARSKYR